MNTINFPNISKHLLRYGLIAVFTWFSLSQFLSPDMWTSFVPSWATDTAFTAQTWVLINATIELVGALLFAFDKWTKWVALLLALHLLGIAFDLGINAIAVRDFGLAISLLSLSLLTWNDNTTS